MYERFDNFLTKLFNSVTFLALTFIVGFVISASITYSQLDFDYATEQDYKPLYQIQETIINDFDNVYSYSNTVIDITDSNIIVFIYGDDCYLKTYFDKTKGYDFTEKTDTTNPIWISIIIVLLISVIGSMIFFLAFVFILIIIDIILEKICNR